MKFYMLLNSLLLIIACLLLGIVSATATTKLIPVLLAFIISALSLVCIGYSIWFIQVKLRNVTIN